MSLLDFILNVAGLLLWLNWRAAPPAVRTPAQTPALSPSRRVTPPRARQFYLLALLALLLGRAVFYWQAGPQLDWLPGIPLGPIRLPFRSDFLGRMLLFSCFSFGATLGVFYLCLLALSSLHSPVSDADPAQRLVRRHLGALGRWPNAAKLLLPMLVTILLWFLLNPLLLRFGMVPKVTPWHLLAQGAVIGLAVYFVLKFLVVGLLLLHLLNSYVYLGDFPFWNFVNTTARGLLRPLRWLPLRIGRVDLAPVVGVALVMLAAEFGRRGLDHLYH
ncbi:MAG: hypothetical protein ABSF38_17420 [Verrucomicrobiota bacterium]|jgi:uncharacterized protein YggT (Ycf19 family)